METHKINGIELLMPQVPKEATTLHLMGWHLHYMIELNHKFIQMPVKQNLTILGTCWYEGYKLVCDFGWEVIADLFNDIPISQGTAPLGPWLRTQGITIPEGFKLVIIKIN